MVNPRFVAMNVHNAEGASCGERSTNITDGNRQSIPYNRKENTALLTQEKALQIKRYPHAKTSDIRIVNLRAHAR